MSTPPENNPPEKIVAQVLIVEDEPEYADVMAEALRRPGHICTIVHGIEAAAEELRHGSFDVIVTDLRMPESAGKATASIPTAVQRRDACAGDLAEKHPTPGRNNHGDGPWRCPHSPRRVQARCV